MTSSAFTRSKSLLNFAGRLLLQNLSDSKSDRFGILRFADLWVSVVIMIVIAREFRASGTTVAIHEQGGTHAASFWIASPAGRDRNDREIPLVQKFGVRFPDES